MEVLYITIVCTRFCQNLKGSTCLTYKLSNLNEVNLLENLLAVGFDTLTVSLLKIHPLRCESVSLGVW